MNEKDRVFVLIKGHKNVSVCMKGLVPDEEEEVFVVIAYFNPKDCLEEYEEMGETMVSFLNSQAEVIRLQALEIELLKSRLKN
jgi:hypothetical protein